MKRSIRCGTVLFVLPLLAAGAAFRAGAAHAALVGYWNFNEGTGTAVYDYSGNGQDAARAGSTLPSWIAGKTGGAGDYALDFPAYPSGGTSYVLRSDAVSNLGGATNFTISFWAKELGTGYYGHMVVAGTGGTRSYMEQNGSGGDQQMWLGYGVSFQATGRDLATSAWKHVVVTYDNAGGATRMKVYVDGVMTSYNWGSNFPSFTAWYMGGWTANNSNFIGDMDDVIVLNHTADATEVAQLGSGTHPSVPWPALLTVTPSGAIGSGGTVTVSNAAIKDDGKITTVTRTNGLNGTWTVAGMASGDLVSADGSKVATATLSGTEGLLNGASVNGTLTLSNVTGKATAGAQVNGLAGPQSFSYTLTGTVAGNTGDGSAVVGSGGGYGGLNTTNDAGKMTVAELLGGTAGSQTTVGVAFNPLGAPAYALGASDVVELTGTGGDLYVLQLSYDDAILADAGARLGWWNSTQWVVQGSGSNLGAYAGQLALGNWGVDAGANKVWAVVDHNSFFAVIPEPPTLLLLGMSLLGLLAYARPKRRQGG